MLMITTEMIEEMAKGGKGADEEVDEVSTLTTTHHHSAPRLLPPPGLTEYPAVNLPFVTSWIRSEVEGTHTRPSMTLQHQQLDISQLVIYDNLISYGC